MCIFHGHQVYSDTLPHLLGWCMLVLQTLEILRSWVSHIDMSNWDSHGKYSILHFHQSDMKTPNNFPTNEMTHLLMHLLSYAAITYARLFSCK